MKANLKTVLFLAGVLLIASVPCALAHTDVTAEQARELIDSTDDLTVVDVREPYEYSDTRGHIPGALNYPFNSGVLQAKYEELPVDGPVLVVCGSGGRSNRAANFLDSMGFSMVYDMLGGMNAWEWETETGVEADSKYGGGTGEPNDPYQIATAEDLMLLGDSPEDYDKHFILTADIDLDPNLPGRKVFDKAVIAPDVNALESDFQGIPFVGVFDGNGHKISHLTVTGVSYLGLFGQLGSWDVPAGEVKNLELVDVNITGSGDYVAGLLGANCGNVSRCHSSGTVIGSGWGTGGLVGGNYGSASQSYSSSLVSGDSAVGGLVGEQEDGSVGQCHSTGDVRGNSCVGGLVGFNYVNSIVTACYSAGSVSGEEKIGGLVGSEGPEGAPNLAWPRPIKITSFWDTQTSGQATSSVGTGKTTAEMRTAGTFLDAGWDFVDETENGTEDIWSICEGTNYPRFVWQITEGDFVCPDGITMDDFWFLLEFWLDDNCDLSNDFCQGTDLNQSGIVDEDDLEIFFENWLAQQ